MGFFKRITSVLLLTIVLAVLMSVFPLPSTRSVTSVANAVQQEAESAAVAGPIDCIDQGTGVAFAALAGGDCAAAVQSSRVFGIDLRDMLANITVPEIPAPVFLSPTADRVNLRAEPALDSPVVGVAHTEDVLQAVDPAAAADQIGVEDAWVQVRTQDGVEGYTAAWLYTVVDTQADTAAGIATPVPAVAMAADAAPVESTSLYLMPVQDRINIRSQPVDGRVIGITSPGEAVEVLEPASTAASKVGVADQWVQVRTQDGIQGYTAAWLYTVAANAAPAVADNTIPPLNADTALNAPNSIADLNVVPDGEVASVQAIQPISGSIIALDVQESAALDTPADTTDAVAVEDPAAAPNAGIELINNIVPVSVDVSDDTAIQMAELDVNGHKLATFTQAPYSMDLDAGLLSVGDYSLTFTVVNTDGMVYADDLLFEVALKEGSTAQRVLLIDGKARPFDFDFSSSKGLTPATVAKTPTLTEENASESLVDILGKPLQSIIPDPVRAALTKERPTLAAIVILLMTLSLLPQGFFTLYWMTYTWNNPEVAEQYRSPREFVEPRYSFTALLPARREESVIKDTIRAVDAIRYPDALKEILILIRDDDDDDTILAAKEAIAEIGKDNVKLVTFTDGPRNKPNGLNRGLKVSTKDVVCVFDAEDEPHPDIYNVVNTVMLRDGADVVQSGVQLMNFKSSWFSAFNVLEYFFWFKSGLHAFTRQFKVTPLGGNTVFFKRNWLQQINGWDEGCLTEDADVGIRLTQLGAKIQIVYDAEHATREETPDTVESFIKQRTRWCQGFYQIFFKGDWLKLPTLTQKIVALYILLNSLLQAAMIFYLPIGIFVALTQEVSVPVALLSYIPIYILVIQMITSLIGIREFTSAYGERLPFGFTLKMIVFYYPYQLIMSVAAMRAVYRFVTLKQGWEKTAHSNLHRQAQLNQVRA